METPLAPSLFSSEAYLLVPDRMLLAEGVVEGHAAVVFGDVFKDVGPADDVIARNPALTPIRLPGKLLMPGFVDAHHHLTQTFGKALAFGEPSEIFRRVWVPLEGALDAELVYLAAKAAALESLRGGFTTVVDAGTRAPGDIGAIAQATKEAGLRTVLGLICNDAHPDADRAAIRKRAETYLNDWSGDALVRPSLAISIPEAASDGMLRTVSRMASEAGAIFQTHVNEHLAAVERSLVDRGRRPLQHLHDLDALGPHALIAHATLVTPDELMMLRETDTAVAYNPVASQWKGNAVAPAMTMKSLGIRFGLGTDGTRSDAFRLMDAAEATQRIAFGLATGDSCCGAGWTWLEHATGAAAEAAGIGGLTGRIATGKAADFLLVDIDTPEFRPSWDLVWELVRLGNRDQITGVFVAGRLRLWQGWPTDWDGRALMREVSRRASAAVHAAPIKRVHPGSSAHRRSTSQNTRRHVEIAE